VPSVGRTILSTLSETPPEEEDEEDEEEDEEEEPGVGEEGGEAT
jgi:hypothetical protein